jgi:hypothetical protein
MFIFNLSLMLGKNFFGYQPFSGVVPLFLPLFYAFLSFLTFYKYFTFWNSVLIYVTVSGGLLTSLSASSFPYFPACSFIQAYSIFQFSFSNALVFFLISSIK